MIKKKLLILIVFSVAFLLPNLSRAQCTSMPTNAAALNSCNLEIALRFAPRHVQFINDDGGHSLSGKSDYITAINYDGDWACHNNWNNLNENSNTQFRAHVYYSVVWTKTHWYIIYAYYHPRDWAQSIFGNEHENDLEGILVIAKRTGANTIDLDNAVLEAGITVFHTDFYAYTPVGSSFTDGEEDIDGTLYTTGGTHPWTAQEAEGHGCKAYPDLFEFNDGRVTYVHNDANIAEFPSDINDSNVKYKLVDIFESGGMWARRNNWSTFAQWGKFNGNEGAGSHKANPPWAWDDGNDGPTYSGEFALDPQHLVDHYFNSSNPISDCYQFLPYDCAYSLSASKSSICNNKEVVFSLHRAGNLPINSSSVNWSYNTNNWECISGCGNNDASITLRAKTNFTTATNISVQVKTIECGDEYLWTLIQPGSNCASAAFHFEGDGSYPKNLFCPGEVIKMDGSASQNESSYYIDAWRRPIGSTANFSWYAGLGWTQGQIGMLNLTNEFAPTEFVPGYEYEIKLAVTNATTGWTPITHRFTVLNSCCKTPINVSYNCQQGRISWDVSAFGYTPSQYRVRVSFDDPFCCGPSPWNGQSHQWTTSNQFFDLPFINVSNCFSVSIGAMCSNDDINWSKTSCSGCKKKVMREQAPEEVQADLEVFPNPSSGVVNLSLSTPADLEVSVEAYDLQGRLVQQLPTQVIPDGQFRTQITLDDNLARGVYLLVFKTNHGTFQQKVILQ